MPETLSLIELTPDDIAKLPAGLHEKIGASLHQTDTESGVWLLVGDGTAELTLLVERAVEILPSFAAKRGLRLTEANIEKILDIVLSDLPRAAAETALEIDNAKLRDDYLRNTPLLTAAEIHAASGLRPQNKSEPASRWKREGRLFAVRRSGIDLYPAFQIADGTPRPAIRSILAALPDDMTDWQIAIWFASANGWLNGAAPQESLSDPEAVIGAARRLADPAVG